MHLVIPESYSRWGWYCAAGSPWCNSVASPPPLSEGPPTSNLGSFPNEIGRGVWRIQVSGCSYQPALGFHFKGGLARSQPRSLQTHEASNEIWVILLGFNNISRTLFVICFLMAKKSRCFMFSRLFDTWEYLSPFRSTLLLSQHLCTLVSDT